LRTTCAAVALSLANPAGAKKSGKGVRRPIDLGKIVCRWLSDGAPDFAFGGSCGGEGEPGAADDLREGGMTGEKGGEDVAEDEDPSDEVGDDSDVAEDAGPAPRRRRIPPDVAAPRAETSSLRRFSRYSLSEKGSTMPNASAPRDRYSRAERVSDAAVHLTGIALALGAVPVLIVLAAMLRGDAAAVAGASVYGATFLLMLTCSAAYNMTDRPDWTWLLRRLDHAAIYLKIAGTYTAVTLLAGTGLLLLAAVWGAAILGVALKLISPARFHWPGIALYLGIGWAGVLGGGALFASLPFAVVVLMIVGGCLYTAGVPFYLWQRLRFHNTIWHVFVLAASLVFYAAVMVQVVAGSPGL
jgi:hemolysin III